MHNDAIERRAVAVTEAPAAATAFIPLLTCVAAGLAIAFTPVLIWRMKTGVWACLQPETSYYLQIAAQAYYNHLWYVSDPIIADGVTFYPWLTFAPVVFLVRMLGLSIFSVALIWAMLAGVGIGASLYLLFWWFIRRPWIAGTLTIFCLADSGFGGGFNNPVVIVSEIRRLVGALVVHPGFDRISMPFFQWRLPDPGLDLPFLFLQIVAVANAREWPRRRNLWIAGLAFGLLFYVFFYLWTMAAAALLLAFLLDPAGRKVYGWTLSIGLVAGLPDLIVSLHSRVIASSEAVARFGMFVRYSRTADLDIPFWSIAIVVLLAIWIRRTGRIELVYLLSLLIAGILLGCSRIVTGIFFHEYHYTWLWWPLRLILILIALATVAEPWIASRPKYVMGLMAFATLYLSGAIYLNAIEVTRTGFGIQQIGDFVRYRRQRTAPGSARLVPRSVIAGAQPFCELAGVAENQRQLSGWTVPISVEVDNSSWEARAALNALLSGVGRAEFRQATADDLRQYLYLKPIQAQLIDDFMHKYDEVAQNPDGFIRELDVRYVALPESQATPAIVKSRFELLEAGPDWQIWQLQP